MSQVPSVGRIVMYTAVDGNGRTVVLPAIITKVHEGDSVNVFPFEDGDSDVMSGVRRRIAFGGPSAPSTWYWPPRVG